MILAHSLTTEYHINNIVGGAINRLRHVRAMLLYLDEEMVWKLTVTMIPPKLECTMTACSASLKKYIRKLERIQSLEQ